MQDESSSKIRRSRRKFSSNPKLQNEIPTQEIPQDDHTQKYFDDETPLAKALGSLRKRKFVSTHEGPSKEGTEKEKNNKRKCVVTVEKPSRRSAQITKLAIKQSLGFVDLEEEEAEKIPSPIASPTRKTQDIDPIQQEI